MNVVVNLVTSRLWVQGTTHVTFQGRCDWTFFYNIEGVSVKQWTVLFYNNVLKRVFLRSPIIDLKIKDVVVQKCKYVSNIFTLMLENTNPSGTLRLWSTEDVSPEANGESSRQPSPYLVPSLYLVGIVTPAKEETYPCAPPILFLDTLRTDKSACVLEKTQSSPFQVSDWNFTVASVAGYTTYRTGAKDHSAHFNKTWIPSVTVNSDTLECSFEIISNKPRGKQECLECVYGGAQSEVLNTTMSNLLVNH